MAWYEGKKGGGGGVPIFTYTADGTTATINNANIGDYYIVSCGNNGTGFVLTVTGADTVYNEVKALGSACTRITVIKATATTVTITRGQSSGIIVVTKLESWDGVGRTDPPFFTSISGNNSVEVSCNIGDYFIISHAQYSGSQIPSVTGADQIIIQNQLYGSTRAILEVVRATATTVTITRNSSGCISVIKMVL